MSDSAEHFKSLRDAGYDPVRVIKAVNLKLGDLQTKGVNSLADAVDALTGLNERLQGTVENILRDAGPSHIPRSDRLASPWSHHSLVAFKVYNTLGADVPLPDEGPSLR
jgi:hypothetical protein